MTPLHYVIPVRHPHREQESRADMLTAHPKLKIADQPPSSERTVFTFLVELAAICLFMFMLFAWMMV